MRHAPKAAAERQTSAPAAIRRHALPAAGPASDPFPMPMPSAIRQAAAARTAEKPQAPSRQSGCISRGHAASPDDSVSQGKPLQNQPRPHSSKNHSAPAAMLRHQGPAPEKRASSHEKIPPQRATYMPSRMAQGAARAQGMPPYRQAAQAIQYSAAAAPGIPHSQPRRKGEGKRDARQSATG